MAIISLSTKKQKTVKDTHALDFSHLFSLSSLFISEFDINKYNKSIIHNKDKPKSSATKPSILIIPMETQAGNLVQLSYGVREGARL